MNESETRAELIDPKLREAGWGEVVDTRILREFRITQGRIFGDGKRGEPEIADYILEYKNKKLAVVEAKKADLEPTEGLGQAKTYAQKLHLPYTYSSNGKEIYEVAMESGKEGLIKTFPTPQELRDKIYGHYDDWKQLFANIPFEDMSGTKKPRYYQEIAVNNALDAIAEQKNRILLTLATGTGKTFIAFQIVWKLFHSRWNLARDKGRRPRVLFLADRNILADQAFNTFNAFTEDALVRITPADIRKKGSVPTNANIFFTIFQTFMTGPENTPYYGDYPTDFFDLIIIDECHRGGANDESNWRGIMEYFSPAVQIGLTATPKRNDNIDTYRYFGDPVYIYSLKEGINDGYLTPFRVKRIQTTLDTYVYTSDDQVIEGDVEEGREYVEEDFNRVIKIMEREKKRVELMLNEINENDKTIVFCATQAHALAVRDLINQLKSNNNPNYCVRVTANDGVLGEQYLRDFQDNEKTIPTILTTSQKLSTGVDARNIRNIILMRPINSIVEFKQIIGRGTRLYEGKNYFTIIDFVNAYKHFMDPEWDGDPIAELCSKCNQNPCICETPVPGVCPQCGQNPCICEKQPKVCKICGQSPCVCEPLPPKIIIKIKLRDGKEREIQHMIQTSFWTPEGKPISVEEFINNLYGELPKYFKNENELREMWANPTTRKILLEKIAEAGYDAAVLTTVQKMISAEDSDLYDVLAYISYNYKPITRKLRISQAEKLLYKGLNDEQKEFSRFVLDKYEEVGVDELYWEKLPILVQMKYGSTIDAQKSLGSIEDIQTTFLEIQKELYLN